MKRLLIALGIVGVLGQAPGQTPLPRVTIVTEVGEITLEIDTARAPLTAANFLRYVDAGLYEAGRFHRTVRMKPDDNQPQSPVKIEVIQAGANPSRAMDYFPPIAMESTNNTGLTHADGVVSMARAQVNSARDQFFICVGDQPELDFGGKRNPDGHGFAAFGRVVSGMEVVRRIHQAPADGQRLTPAVKILSARRQ